ncbi:glycosyltransferase [Enterobacteriaceae bacterium LUAb1]
MKVLHAAETIKGGVATVLKQLVAAQQTDTSLFTVQCLIPADQAEELDNVAGENKIFWHRNGRNIAALFMFSCAFCKAVLRFKPDIVHLHSSFAGVIGRLCLIFLWPVVRPKVVYCPHAFSFLMQTSRIKKRLYSLIEKMLLPMTHAIICVSEYEANQARKRGFCAHKLHIIHNGVPVKAVKPVLSERTKAPVRLLFVGRLDYQKGYDLLVAAMKRLTDKPLCLTVIGDVVQGAGEIEKLPSVHYTGWLKASQLEHYFLTADALVIPSRWEGFAMVPLEAMSYSLPVIASDATSLPEVVTERETGFLFKNGDTDSLVYVLSELDKYDLKGMGDRGNRLFSQHFTSQQMIAKTHALYMAIASC